MSWRGLLVSRKGAKAQSQDNGFTFPAFYFCALAAWREVKPGIDKAFEDGQIVMFSAPIA
jgi:hypothetical protein